MEFTQKGGQSLSAKKALFCSREIEGKWRFVWDLINLRHTLNLDSKKNTSIPD